MTANTDSQPKLVPLPSRPNKRAWKAAESSDLLSGWLQAARPPDVDIRNALRPLRARSREQAQNNDLMRSYLAEVVTNIVGAPGIRMQGRSKFANGRLNKRVNDAHESAWLEWGQRGVCDVTGELSLDDLVRLSVRTAAMDGEFVIRKVTPWDNGFGFALQVIDPEALDVGYDAELPNGNRVVMGIELDAWRRRVAYYLTEEPSNPYMSSYSQQAKRERVPSGEIIHGYLPEWCWQTRGVPWAAASLGRLKMVGGYEEAAVVASRQAASKMAFFTHEGDGGIGLDGERNESGDLIKDAVPGGMEELPPGYGVSAVNWDWPNSDHGSFMRPVLRSIAAGLGVSHPSWARDLEGVNYSSLRHGALQERDIWRVAQQWAVNWMMGPIHAGWSPAAVLSGALATNQTPEQLKASAAWQPRGWDWVDPEKGIKSARAAVALRVKSVSQIIRERGNDPGEVWEELADDKERLQQLGLDLPELTEDTESKSAATEEE